MLIYINGDSHAAAAEAVVPYGWAEDDPFFSGLGRRPHPDNERVSFGCEIANQLHAIMDCDAQSGASNQRIMRTTREWIERTQPGPRDLLIVQWSTWEREEWIIEGEYHQVGASGTDSVPQSHQENYRSFIRDMNWHERRRNWHQDIWEFHCELKEQGLRHVFFNGNNHFADQQPQHDWQNHYIAPYDENGTYDAVLRANGYKTVNDQSWHFGADAHCFWANYVLQYIHDHKL